MFRPTSAPCDVEVFLKQYAVMTELISSLATCKISICIFRPSPVIYCVPLLRNEHDARLVSLKNHWYHIEVPK